MTSFNELFNVDDTLDTINTTSEEHLFLRGNANYENESKIQIAFDNSQSASNIYYLDSSRIYNQKHKLGDYVLKQHQLTSLWYMLEMENMIYNIKNTLINKKNDTIVKTQYTTKHYTNIGILCDQVGAGKSYCIMGLLNESKSLKSIQIPFRNTSIGSHNITIKNIRKLDTNILLHERPLKE